MSRDHALHNSAACDLLHENGEFTDWVATTAFYSALHWMREALFPHEVTDRAGVTVELLNFDEYKDWDSHQHGGRQSASLHRMLRNLVVKKCPQRVADAYEILFDTCHTARYVDYRIDPRVAAKARKQLRRVRRHCDPDWDELPA